MKRARNSHGKRPKRELRKPRIPRLAALPSIGNRTARSRPTVLITGGAGFIGTNLAHYYLSKGHRVLLYDNLSRPGVERNLAWLRQTHGTAVSIQSDDIQDFARLRKAVRGIKKVFHFAAQVAVTTSMTDPFQDFEVNARGTLNLLEALRELAEPPPLVFTSTNKVYGNLEDVTLRETDLRYEPEDQKLRLAGFDESRPLDFHSPYGCSKGAAEQYVLDYARTFRLPAVVFRMSCIYGPHQFGNEDQGWVAHFLIRALEASPITVYGDGKQVRDILFVDDLVEAFVQAQQHIGRIAGQMFNIGGGAANTISLLELIELITQMHDKAPTIRFDDWRAADQQYYVSNTAKFGAATGWSPKVNVRQGIQRLNDWLRQFRTTPGVPVVVSAPAMVSNGNGHKPAPALSTLPTVPEARREPRSKRLWKLGAADGELDEKIIKFP